ncbi:MAG: transporter [Eubacterium sp.]|jgi:raffinose/stachyose/melibiose transport system permease protein|nr:transporter [Eubacterium sp.]
MKKKLSKYISVIVKILICAVFVAPFYISLVYSAKSREETIRTGLAFPTSIHWENFARAIDVSNFWNATKNSLIITICGVVLILAVCSMAAYVIARNDKSRFYNTLYYVFLGALLLPFQVVMLPLYVQLKDLHMLNTRTGMILTIAGLQIAYNVFIYTGFVKGIPREMDEAAYIDGAGKFRTFWSIIFPLMKPINSSAMVLNALALWNEFQASLIIAQKNELRTIPLTQFYFFGQYSVELNMAFAAFVLAMLPIIALYLLMQRYIVSGIMSGAVKG